MIRRPPRSTLFPYTTPLPICEDGEDDCEVSAKWRAALHRPSREGFFRVARTRTSPGFGRTARLPGDPSGVEPCCLPVTVAGARRAPTRLRGPRSLGRRRRVLAVDPPGASRAVGRHLCPAVG